MVKARREIRHITLAETGSTNSYCKAYGGLDAPFAVRAETQTAGRGQRGNQWEAAPGKNLTFSLVWQPQGVAPREQFSISEATALGVAAYLEERGISAKVKWPNDIYVDDCKICGILIEHSVAGPEIQRSILGVGLNVNQTEFVSDAPNPVSMRDLTGLVYNLDEEFKALTSVLQNFLERVATEEGRKRVHDDFISHLWRKDGCPHLFREPATDRKYEGIIRDVAPDGYLKVEDVLTGEVKNYAFKEVEFCL